MSRRSAPEQNGSATWDFRDLGFPESEISGTWDFQDLRFPGREISALRTVDLQAIALLINK